MKHSILFLFGLLFSYQLSFAQEEISPDSAAILEEAAAAYLNTIDSIESKLSYQTGNIELIEGVASIIVPDGYKFLDATQSEYVLTDLWGNPPSKVLGLLFPENVSPMSDNFTYAVEITYSEEGYIDDEDAKDLDYDDLLEEMQGDAEASNEQRVAQGYGTVEIVGWASPPYYDEQSKKLHWAKELKFDGSEMNTLNYNIRILGRKGYINMNAIGNIDVLPLFNSDIDKVLASVNFEEGSRYSDFNPDIDKVAAYGIGGLIAGKVLTKVGIFAMLAKFWKVIAIAVARAFAALKKFLFPSKEEPAEENIETQEEEHNKLS